jgi:hypothetical protein
MFDACILLCRLQSQVLDLDGVGDAWLGPFIEGGLRGGSVTVQTEVEKRLPLSMLIKSIQALDDALLVLPFKTNYWLWRGNKINYAVAGCGKPLILIHGFGNYLHCVLWDAFNTHKISRDC